MTIETTRERTLKLFADDREWEKFSEAIPRDWRKRFERLAECVQIDVEARPDRKRGTSYLRFTIPDCRANQPSAYKTAHRRGQLIRSWDIGVRQRTDKSRSLSFSDGITWGSIGQFLGYLLGDIPKSERKKYYDRIFDSFQNTDHGQSLLKDG